jgi:glycosyltransferase involved in cell wall biosynthesis
MIEDGVNGRLVEPEDSETLADRLLELLRSKDERERLGAAVRRTVEDRFGWAKAGEEYARIASGP